MSSADISLLLWNNSLTQRLQMFTKVCDATETTCIAPAHACSSHSHRRCSDVQEVERRRQVGAASSSVLNCSWRSSYDNCRTIPIVEVVDAMKVFHTEQGAQGMMTAPSKQQLDSVFGSTKMDDAVLYILEHGELLAASKSSQLLLPSRKLKSYSLCSCKVRRLLYYQRLKG